MGLGYYGTCGCTNTSIIIEAEHWTTTASVRMHYFIYSAIHYGFLSCANWFITLC